MNMKFFAAILGALLLIQTGPVFGQQIPASELPPAGTDKIMRLHLQTALFANGNVLLPRLAPWLADYVAELTGFPGTKFDDQVDSTSQALQFLKEGSDGLARWARFGAALPTLPYRSAYWNVFTRGSRW